MKTNEFLKFVAIAAITTSFTVGCSSQTAETDMTETSSVEDCMGATPEVKNAIYAAKLKNARARNLGMEWRETAKLIDKAEQEAEICNNDAAKKLADDAERQAAAAISQFHAEQEKMEMAEATTAGMGSMGTYLVVSGDNL